MEFITFVILACIAWGLWNLRSRLGDLENELASARTNTPTLGQLNDLAWRVWQLEHPAGPVEHERVEQKPVEQKPVAEEAAVEDVVVEQLPAEEEPVLEAPLAEWAPQEPAPSLPDRLRRLLGDQEWESLVGGSLLNKLGALILVIGIALFLGYSFGHMTAAGRAAISVVVSAAILAAGIRVEQLGQYKVFARGLIGAGWAALYATSYAVYAIPEARIIDDPAWGSLGMVAVAVGMIWHSLRYRAQAITAVAYFAAFAAMAVTPSSPFAVVSLIPLAASLLFLAARFEWYEMALFGLAATWLTCISRGDSGAPLAATQSLFLAYWVLFEGFDLLRTKRRVRKSGLDLLFPLNAACFLGLSYLTWSSHAPERLWLASAFGAALFLADAICRAAVRPPATFDADESLVARLRAGSFEGAFVIAAILAGLAIAGRVPGVWTSVGLAFEAEIVYLAGVRLNSAFLRRLGARAFALSLLRVLWTDRIPSMTEVLGHATWNWTPPALFHAVLFYINRAIRKPNALFSWSATAIGAIVLAAELPEGALGTAWILFGLVLFEIGLRRHLAEFRMQAYALFASAFTLAASSFFPYGWNWGWPALAISLGALYGCAVRSRWIGEEALLAREKRAFALGASGGTTLLAAALLWKIVPGDYVGLAWCLLAVALLELGARRLPAELRWYFGPMALAALVEVIGTHLDDFAKFPAPAVWITYFGACAAAAVATMRLTLQTPEEGWEPAILRDTMAALACAAAFAGIWLVTPDAAVTVLWTAAAIGLLEGGVRLCVPSFQFLALAALGLICTRVFGFDLEHSALRAVPVAVAGMYWGWYRFRFTPFWSRVAFWTAILPVVFLIGHQAGRYEAPLGWIAVSIVLLAAGTRFRIPDARLQSYLIALLAFLAAIWFDADPPRLWTACFIVAGFYTAQGLAKGSAEKRAPAAFSLLGTLLLGAVLYGKVSGGLLTVSWGFEGLALLGCGFVFRERILRLQGLALLLVCIMKLFAYDLRNLDTVYRILSFVALGLILLCVSWIYTRFREHLRRLL